MAEENENVRMSKAEHPVDETQKLSEDAGGLGPMQVGPIVVGLVDEIVGEGGVEVPGCVITKYESVQIVKHWAAEIIDLDFSYFLHASTGSSEWRIREYANRRLNTIAQSIGEQEVETAFKQAGENFAKTVDQRAWKIFTEARRKSRNDFSRKCRRNWRATVGRARNDSSSAHGSGRQ